MGRRVDADREGDDPGEEHGRKCDDHRQPEAVADDLADGKLVFEGIAEIALQKAPHPIAVLLDEGVAEMELVLQNF